MMRLAGSEFAFHCPGAYAPRAILPLAAKNVYPPEVLATTTPRICQAHETNRRVTARNIDSYLDHVFRHHGYRPVDDIGHSVQQNVAVPNGGLTSSEPTRRIHAG